MALDKGHRQLLAEVALPAGLQQQVETGAISAQPGGGRGHGHSKGQIILVVHHHFQLVAPAKQLLGGGAVRLRREGDPVEAAAEGVDAAGFQMEGETFGIRNGLMHRVRRRALPEDCTQVIEGMLQRFATGDHHERGSGGTGLLGQGLHPETAMRLSGPGVFGVAPGTAHRAARQADEEGAAAYMNALALKGMEGFHHRQGAGVAAG